MINTVLFCPCASAPEICSMVLQFYASHGLLYRCMDMIQGDRVCQQPSELPRHEETGRTLMRVCVDYSVECILVGLLRHKV